MSEYCTVELKISDQECLSKALTELGFVHEIHEIPQNLYGYTGDKRSQKANVIIRKKHIGSASNDIGFFKEANGNYTLLISEYDKAVDKKIQNKLNQIYSKYIIKKQAESMGYTISEQTYDAQGRLKIKVSAGFAY
jgi:hypothetical protein